MKTKIKYHGDKVTDFYYRKIPKLDSNHTFLAVKLGFCSQKNDNYYPQVFLKECKYIKNNAVLHIHDSLSDFSYSSDDSDEE